MILRPTFLNHVSIRCNLIGQSMRSITRGKTKSVILRDLGSETNDRATHGRERF
jgi:hypothetical protein